MSLRLRALVPERGVDLELEVADGQTLALVGPNGAGKSTVLSLIAGDLRPGTSRVELDGRVLSAPGHSVPPHRRTVATLSQDPVLFPHLTALGNVAFALRAQGMPRARARQQGRRWLEELGIAELADRRPARLSGGQAQRVAIARALAADPRLLLLDEPMAALDIDVSPALRAQLRRFLAGRTALIVTHDVLDALTLADRTVVLGGGRVLEQGPTAEVLTRPRSAFAARFAGLNLVSGRWEDGGLRLEDGALLPGHGELPTGAAALAAFRPAEVRLVATGGIARTVTALSHHGDLIRLSTEDLAADLTPQQVAAAGIAPGSPVRLHVPDRSIVLYPPSPHAYDGTP